ncbi:MAG TPA: DMT family transporter [Ferruginibacter sp.]|nr:DMT family transporter [Ferruginibacter sp.]
MAITGSFIACFAALCWAISAFPFTKAARAMSVSSMNLFRLMAGTFLVLITALVANPVGFTGVFSAAYVDAWTWMGLSGITALGIGDYFSYRMYTILSPRNGTALGTFSPAAAWLIGNLLLDETINLVGLAGMAITIVGVLTMSLGRTERSRIPDHGHGNISSGILFGIIGAICNGAGIVFSKKAFLLQEAAGANLPPLTGSFMRFFVATVIVLLLMLIRNKLVSNWKNILKQPRPVIQNAVAGTVFGPLLAVSCALISIQYIPAAVAQTIFTLVPVAAILIAHFFYKEKITPFTLAGVVTSIAGVGMLIWRNDIFSLFKW